MHDGDTLISRDRAAEVIGISTTEFRRRQKTGLYQATKMGVRGEHLFSLQEMRALAKKELRASVAYSGEQASIVFQALESGKTPIQCVVELQVPPSVVNVLVDEYAALSGGMFVKAETLLAINKLDLDGPFPLQKDVELLEFMQSKAKEKCLECNKRTRHLCKTCVQATLKAAREGTEGL